MTVHDGNGWTRCGRGHRHWGKHGAAGLLASAPSAAGEPLVLLAQRSWWGSHGGAWGPPGGARDSHESAVSAALREAAEECAIDPAAVQVHGIWNDDHGGWTYQTVLASTAEPLPVAAVSEETSEVAWVPDGGVERLGLHPGFAAQWPELRAALVPPVIVVDVANVMGSRPDGWWRDRAGAARRLCDEIAELAVRGMADLGGQLPVPALDWWFPRFVVVLEGAATRFDEPAGWPEAMTVARAPGSGDDEIARQAAGAGGPEAGGPEAGGSGGGRAGAGRAGAGRAEAGGAGTAGAAVAGARLVVTADRELRRRCQEAGAYVTGPRWLLSQLSAAPPATSA